MELLGVAGRIFARIVVHIDLEQDLNSYRLPVDFLLGTQAWRRTWLEGWGVRGTTLVRSPRKISFHVQTLFNTASIKTAQSRGM